MQKLAELKIGEKCKVVKVSGESSIRRRIMDMGIVKGTEILVERVAPLGDPFEIIVRGYHLSLRKEESENIFVEPIK